MPSSVDGASPPPPSPSTGGEDPEVLVGAGDIARCDTDADEATAQLLDSIEGTIFAAGDTVYDSGRPEEYRDCYGPTWGRHLDRTLFPAPGDHEYETEGAAGYLDYFGQAAAPEGTTWYSHDAGAWHVISLDAHCELVDGCDDEGAQLAWLIEDLAASGARCTAAVIHYPRFSSGFHGGYEEMTPLWRALHDAGAELVISGDDHSYERFAPQDPDGNATPDGIRQFVAGTGGTFLREMEEIEPNSEVTNSDTHGVLRLELSKDGYAWQFIPVAGQSFSDAGTGTCH